MTTKKVVCPDCDGGEVNLNRRGFLRTAGWTAAAATASVPLWATPRAQAAPTTKSAAETAVKALYDSLSDKQRKVMCFDWDYEDKEKKRGLLRTFVSNNWHITEPRIRGGFYSIKQQDIIHDIFQGLINPEWYGKFLKQLRDDTGGKLWGSDQSIAIFGKPGDDKFEFVMTGRHMTLRADGNTESHVAFGGPIFYGHAAQGFNEKANHPGNVFWPQALLANKVYTMLDQDQQKKALVANSPDESDVSFHGPEGKFPGIPFKELADSQQKELNKVLKALIEPFRTEDQDKALECLSRQGGLDKCALAFYSDEDIGKDGVWDNWRLEGPAFAWYFRGCPHVHVWVHVADDPSVKLNSKG
jgi:hypothetical protein